MSAPAAERQPYRRRLRNGETVPASETGRTWDELVVPGPKPVGCASDWPSHPSHKHRRDDLKPTRVLTRSADVQGPVPGQPRRRDRRAAERAA